MLHLIENGESSNHKMTKQLLLLQPIPASNMPSHVSEGPRATCEWKVWEEGNMWPGLGTPISWKPTLANQNAFVVAALHKSQYQSSERAGEKNKGERRFKGKLQPKIGDTT